MKRVPGVGLSGAVAFAAILAGSRPASAQLTTGEGHPEGYYGHGIFGDTHPELKNPWDYPDVGWYYPLGGSAWAWHPSPFYYDRYAGTYNPYVGWSSYLQPWGPTNGSVLELDPWYVRRDHWYDRHPNDPWAARRRAYLERKAPAPDPAGRPGAEAPKAPEPKVEPAAREAPPGVAVGTRPPDPQGRELYLVGVGDELLRKGDFAGALAAYEKAVGENPGSPVAPFAVAHARLALADVPGAAARLREGLARNPAWAEERMDLRALLPEGSTALDECRKAAAEKGADGLLVEAYLRWAAGASDDALDTLALLPDDPAARTLEAGIRKVRSDGDKAMPAEPRAPEPPAGDGPP